MKNTTIVMANFTKQEALKPYFEDAYGWAVLPVIGKAGIIAVGGATGNGKVYINNKYNNNNNNNKGNSGDSDVLGTRVGDCSMFQASLGFQLGAEVYSEIIFFQTRTDYDNFCSGEFEFGADANVVALTASASAKISTLGNQGFQAGLTSDGIKVNNNLHLISKPNIDATTTRTHYTKGMAVFTVMQGGLMYEASISGQKFNFVPASRFPELPYQE